MKTEVKKTTNIFGEEICFIVQTYKGKIERIAGVGNLIKYYPEDCPVSSGQIAAQRIVDLSQKKIRTIAYASDGTYFRRGSNEFPLTQEYLNDLIVYGYSIEERENGVFIKLENSEHDISISFNGEAYCCTTVWRNGFKCANDTIILEEKSIEDAVLKCLANHF